MSLIQEKIRKWVQLDNKINELKSELGEYKTEKNELTAYINDNVQENALIKLPDSELRFKEERSTSSLTLKYVKECLSHFIPNGDQVDTIMNYIKSNRDVKYNRVIKRTYAK